MTESTLKRSARNRLFLAGGFVLILSIWMLTGVLRSDDGSEDADPASDDVPVMSVEIQAVALSPMDREVVVQGQLDAHRRLEIRAETSGVVESIEVDRGQRVRQGNVLLSLKAGEREAALSEARARVTMARSERDAAQDLSRRGLQAPMQLEQSNAALESALAQLDRIERDLRNTRIKAPFDGIVNRAPQELGALVERGDVVAEVVDNSRYTVRGQVSQQDVGRLRLGQAVQIELITGARLEGRLSWISAVADQASRSFAIEADVLRPPLAQAAEGNAASAATETLPSGISATIRIPTDTVQAAFITPSVLVLGTDGELGVMVVDGDNIARFVPVEMITSSLKGAWVSGMDVGTRLITRGQGFINPGDRVEPTFAP